MAKQRKKSSPTGEWETSYINKSGIRVVHRHGMDRSAARAKFEVLKKLDLVGLILSHGPNVIDYHNGVVKPQ